MELLVVGAAVTSCIGAWFMATEVYDDGLKGKPPTEIFDDYKHSLTARKEFIQKGSDYVFWNTVDNQVPSTFDASVNMKTVKARKKENSKLISKPFSTRNQNRTVC